MFNIINHLRNANKKHKIHFTSTKMISLKWIKASMVQMQRTGIHTHYWWECKIVQLL